MKGNSIHLNFIHIVSTCNNSHNLQYKGGGAYTTLTKTQILPLFTYINVQKGMFLTHANLWPSLERTPGLACPCTHSSCNSCTKALTLLLFMHTSHGFLFRGTFSELGLILALPVPSAIALHLPLTIINDMSCRGFHARGLFNVDLRMTNCPGFPTGFQGVGLPVLTLEINKSQAIRNELGPLVLRVVIPNTGDTQFV